MEENVGIPINVGDLPIDAVNLEDDKIYACTLEKVTLALKLDKNDHMYISIKCTIVDDEDYEGLNVERNYLALPLYVAPDAPKKMKLRVQNHNAPFGRFVRSFKIKGALPPVLDIRDNEGRAKFQEWWEQFYGNRGSVSIENAEFPAGSGRMRSSIRDFTGF